MLPSGLLSSLTNVSLMYLSYATLITSLLTSTFLFTSVGTSLTMPEEVPCSVRIREQNRLTSLLTHADIELKVRTLWAEKLMKLVSNAEPHDVIQPLDFLLSMDGSVRDLTGEPFDDLKEVKTRNSLEILLGSSKKIQAMKQKPHSDQKATGEKAAYPAHSRIPPGSIADLDQSEQVKRAESFALGSLLYEIFTNDKPFAAFNADEVQIKFSQAQVPADDLPPHLCALIYTCWSFEFAQRLTELGE